MKKILIFSQIVFGIFLSTQSIAAPTQQIYVSNMVWNPNGTGGAKGLTPTSIVVAFKNGGTKPCYTTTLPFEGATTILVGTGQHCAATVTAVSITPVAGPTGNTYATPADITVPGAYYSTQIVLTDNTDPIFDTTNATIRIQGTIQASVTGS